MKKMKTVKAKGSWYVAGYDQPTHGPFKTLAEVRRRHGRSLLRLGHAAYVMTETVQGRRLQWFVHTLEGLKRCGWHPPEVEIRELPRGGKRA